MSDGGADISTVWLLVGLLGFACTILLVLVLRAMGQEAGPPAPSTMHKLNFQLQERGRAETFIGHEKPPGGVVRIALTGGPCAGKSSALAHIIEYGKKEGFDCYVGPETATVIMNCGCAVPGTLEGLQIFQSQIFKFQIQMESALIRIAEETNRPSIIIFDRGIFDGKGYIPDHIWCNVIAEYDERSSREVIEDMLLSRYDAVVHMVTAADGAENYYKFGHVTDNSGKPVLRRETPEEARELDDKMWKMWENHDNHIRIENKDGGFSSKLQEVAQKVVHLAKETMGQSDDEDDNAIRKKATMAKRELELIGKQISVAPKSRPAADQPQPLARSAPLGGPLLVPPV